MDIDEFLEAEVGGNKDGLAKKQLEEKQSASFITGRSIEGQLAKVRELIKQRQFKEAEKIYFVVKEHYATLAKKQEEEQRRLHRQIAAINKELLSNLDRVKGEMQQKAIIIADLLQKAKQYMQQGNIEKANKLYLEVRQIFRQLPDAFGEQKMLLENQILSFYSQLVSEFNKKNYGLLLQKRDEIMRHIEMATNLIRLGKIEQAKAEYQVINKLYDALPEGFLYEKSLIYKRILALHQLTVEGMYKAPSQIPSNASRSTGQIPYHNAALPPETGSGPQAKDLEAPPMPIKTAAKTKTASTPKPKKTEKKGKMDEPPLPM